MYRLLKTESTILTVEHVRVAQNASDVPGERPLKKARKQQIVDWLANNDFVRANIGYATCKQDGKTYRVNGNHTSSVLVACANGTPEMPPFPESVPVTIEYWECDTVDELVEIFDTYDNPVSSRTSGDKLGVYCAQFQAELGSVKTTMVSCALRGVNIWRKFQKEPEQPGVAARELGQLLADATIRQFVLFLADFDGATWPGYQKAGVTAAAYELWQTDPSMVKPLLEELFEESNADPKSETRQLATRLREQSARKGKGNDYFYRQVKSTCFKLLKAHQLALANGTAT